MATASIQTPRPPTLPAPVTSSFSSSRPTYTTASGQLNTHNNDNNPPQTNIFSAGILIASFLQFLARELNLALSSRITPQELAGLTLCDNSEFDRWNDGVFFQQNKENFVQFPSYGSTTNYWTTRMATSSSPTDLVKSDYSLNASNSGWDALLSEIPEA
ncbi:3611_t:CDS:1, partial [Ambispora gerdemannii]